jgi:WD40 repeat protein
VWDLAFHEDGRRLVSSSFDHDVRVWELAAEGARCERVLSGHRRQVGSVCLLGSRHALSGSRDGTCRVWDLDGGKSRAFAPHALLVMEDR